MAYAPANSSSPNPPFCFSNPIAMGSTQHSLAALGSTIGGGLRLWFYDSTHTQAAVGTSDFISDGRALGMHRNDIVFVGTPTGVSVHRVTGLGSTFTGLSAGLNVSSAS